MDNMYAANIKLNSNFDFRGTKYDLDGYMLVGTAVCNTAPTVVTTGAGATLTTVSEGYLYLCAKDGSTTAGMSCGYTYGTAAQMGTNTKIGTVTST